MIYKEIIYELNMYDKPGIFLIGKKPDFLPDTEMLTSLST